MSTTTTTGHDPVTGQPVRTTTTHDTHPLNAAVGAGRTTTVETGAVTAKELQREIHEAYERGRADQRKAHKSNPLLTILVVLLAVLGAAVIFLAIRDGGFSEAGQSLDQGAAVAREEAVEAGRQAQGAAGEAAQDAGAALQGAGAEVEREAETAASAAPN